MKSSVSIIKNPITKRDVARIMTGHCRVYPNELSESEYILYLELRVKVYKYNEARKNQKKYEKYHNFKYLFGVKL